MLPEGHLLTHTYTYTENYTITVSSFTPSSHSEFFISFYMLLLYSLGKGNLYFIPTFFLVIAIKVSERKWTGLIKIRCKTTFYSLKLPDKEYYTKTLLNTSFLSKPS